MDGPELHGIKGEKGVSEGRMEEEEVLVSNS